MSPEVRDRLDALRAVVWRHEDPSPWVSELIGPEMAWRGVRAAGLDPAWREALAQAGVPLAGGGLAFERIFDPAAIDLPETGADGRLRLPPPDRLTVLTSLPLKPLRMAMAGRFGIRLQIAVGVHCFLGATRAVLLNTTEQPRSGFLHGPRHGMRAALAMEPGEVQVVPL